MSSATVAASETIDRWDESLPPAGEARPAAVLKGGPRGLEILIDVAATADAIAAALTQRLEEAPGFFRGSDVRVRIDGAIPAGCLARLEEIAARFALTIVEIGPRKPAASGPVLRPIEPSAPVEIAPEAPEIEVIEAIEAAAPPFEIPLLASPPREKTQTRMVVGPVRSGVILDHPGNVVVVGDVNPGAEVRAEGNIVILGRLRGIAHAAIGRELGFILALQLEPQQLRVGRLVARAPDSTNNGIEIAYVTDKTIVVERYAGKLPHGLAAGI